MPKFVIGIIVSTWFVSLDADPMQGTCSVGECAGAKHVDDMGCWKPAEWLLVGPRAVQETALPTSAKLRCCYDGRATAALEPESLRGSFATPAYADSAVLLVDDFLTPVEVDYLQSVVRNNTYSLPKKPWYHAGYAAGEQYDPMTLPKWKTHAVAAFAEDPIVNAVETRISGFLGLPKSVNESHLQLVRTGRMTNEQSVSLEGRPFFHRDKNGFPSRRATVLVYLTDVEAGGATIFPALPFRPGGPVARSEEIRSLAQDLGSIPERFNLMFGRPPNRQSLPAPVGNSGGELSGRELSVRLTQLCTPARASKKNDVQPLSVQPRPGRAVIFFQEAVEDADVALLDIWHGGCPVLQGDKLAIQKFKSRVL